jgi:hypothetical protein
VVIRRDPTRITLDEWRSDLASVKLARKFLDDPEFRLMVDVLRTSHLVNYVMDMRGVAIEDRAAMQARGEGYTMCLINLEALGDFRKPKQEIEPTFEEEERPDQPENE